MPPLGKRAFLEWLGTAFLLADDRVEYTLEELAEIAETLGENHESLSNYGRRVGLIDRRMDV